MEKGPNSPPGPPLSIIIHPALKHLSVLRLIQPAFSQEFGISFCHATLLLCLFEHIVERGKARTGLHVAKEPVRVRAVRPIQNAMLSCTFDASGSELVDIDVHDFAGSGIVLRNLDL